MFEFCHAIPSPVFRVQGQFHFFISGCSNLSVMLFLSVLSHLLVCCYQVLLLLLLLLLLLFSGCVTVADLDKLKSLRLRDFIFLLDYDLHLDFREVTLHALEGI